MTAVAALLAGPPRLFWKSFDAVYSASIAHAARDASFASKTCASSMSRYRPVVASSPTSASSRCETVRVPVRVDLNA